jgi:hypothetical protein
LPRPSLKSAPTRPIAPRKARRAAGS